MPRVSVVVPNYNHARFLERRLRSILGQTFQDFELIYLDDASSDASEEIVARFASDPRMRCIRNRVNGGSPFKQWNRGVYEAMGEYVWIAESDDAADERLLATLVDRLDQNPNVGLAYCQSWRVDEQEKHLGSSIELLADMDSERWRCDFVADGRAECARYLLLKNTIPNASAVVFRRSTYLEMGGADEGMRLCGDWLAWVEILLRSDLAFVAEPLNFHRTHAAALRNTTELERSATEGWRVSQRILDEVRPDPDALRQVRDRFANEWASVTVLKHKRTLDEGIERFRRLKRHDPLLFPARASREVLRYALAAVAKWIRWAA